jgi:signal transduction histidine kinase/CheY-like chemotaxis protein
VFRPFSKSGVLHPFRLGLRLRLLLIIVLAASTMGWCAWEVLSHSILARFANLENHHAFENAIRAKNLVAERASQIAGHASDWGAWDETYAYVEDLNEEYVKANLTSDGIARLNISCLLYLDTKGGMKASVGFDFETNQLAPTPQPVLEKDWSRFSLANANLNDKLSGMVLVENEPYLMGASQILTSEGTGPVRGTILELRKLDERELASLSKSLRFPFSISESISNSSTSSKKPSYNELLDAKTMAAHIRIEELKGEGGVDFFCTLNREIMAEGMQALDDVRKHVLMMGGLLSLLVYLLMGKIVIARICKMTSEINSPSVLPGRSRVSDRGSDELGDLAKQFNSLFESMLASQSELSERNKELANAKRQADTANRSKSAFLANMSHEIRTPLTAILGFTEILREDPKGDWSQERRLESLNTIQCAGQHLLTVINDILDLSKIEAEKMTLETVPVSIRDILLEIRDFLLPRANEKSIGLGIELVSPIPQFLASDPTRLRQTILNLVGNAVKFTQKGSVTIRCGVESHDSSNSLFVDVVDTGVGLSQEQAEGLFQPFSQADDTVTRQFGGTGLGLVICRRLANLMGGTVLLTRSEVGAGSCFRLILPIEKTALDQMLSTLDLPSDGRSKPNSAPTKLEGRILLAEDGLDNQKLISFLLRKAGAQVDVAENGLVALNMMEKAEETNSEYDLLITDMQMPIMDGYTLASTLRERENSIAIIALTAHAMAEDRARCLDAGCDEYETKPINKTEFLATCQKWIGKKRAKPSKAIDRGMESLCPASFATPASSS